MSSDDEDMKLAIARSLEDSKIHRSSSKDDPIIISSDEDEPLSGISYAKENVQKPPMSNSHTDSLPSASAGTSASTLAFLSERAQLEAARLARLKRIRESNTNSQTLAKSSLELASEDPSLSLEEMQNPPAKKFKLSAPSISNYHANTPSSSSFAHINSSKAQGKPSGSQQGSSVDEGELFWEGELRQNANMHVDKGRDTRPLFRMHDVLGNKTELTLVILSSYVTQHSWIYSLLPPSVPVLLVAQPDESGSSSVHNMLPNWVKVTPFLRGGRGCMHIKFMLLFYKSGRMRVVITTANLVDYDWRDIENSVWLQDVPRRQTAIPRDSKADDFPAHFERVLDALNVRNGLRALKLDHPNIPLGSITELRCCWDFSKVRAQLVPSLAGKYEGWPSVLRVGHVRLMRVVRTIGARSDVVKPKGIIQKSKGKEKISRERDLHLECQGSSIGSYTPAWIDEFYRSARGASPEDWLDEPKTRRIKRLDGMLAQHGWKPWGNIKILFPSLRTVKASFLGENGGGTMFCQRRQWIAPKFPRSLFYDSNSRRGPVLMHTKMILATFKDSQSDSAKSTLSSTSTTKYFASPSGLSSSATESDNDSDEEVKEINPEHDPSITGWLYVGSHNFTPSAWGTLSGSSFSPILNITNFELGVVIPIKSPEQVDELICWERPPRKYDLKMDEPWVHSNNR